MQDAGCEMRDTGCRMQDNGLRPSSNDFLSFRSLRSGHALRGAVIRCRRLSSVVRRPSSIVTYVNCSTQESEKCWKNWNDYNARP
jgi:hypothetical protein